LICLLALISLFLILFNLLLQRCRRLHIFSDGWHSVSLRAIPVSPPRLIALGDSIVHTLPLAVGDLHLEYVEQVKISPCRIRAGGTGVLRTDDVAEQPIDISASDDNHIEFTACGGTVTVEPRGALPLELFGLHWTLAYGFSMDLFVNLLSGRGPDALTRFLSSFNELSDQAGSAIYCFHEGTSCQFAISIRADGAQVFLESVAKSLFDNPPGRDGEMRLHARNSKAFVAVWGVVRFGSELFSFIHARHSHLFFIRENERLFVRLVMLVLPPYIVNMRQAESIEKQKFRAVETLLHCAMLGALTVDQESQKIEATYGDCRALDYIADPAAFREHMLGIRSVGVVNLFWPDSLRVRSVVVKSPIDLRMKVMVLFGGTHVSLGFEHAAVLLGMSSVGLIRRDFSFLGGHRLVEVLAKGTILSVPPGSMGVINLPWSNRLLVYRLGKGHPFEGLSLEIGGFSESAIEEIVVTENPWIKEPLGIWIIDCETKEIAWSMMDQYSSTKIGARRSNEIDRFLIGLCHPADLVSLREVLSHIDSAVPARMTIECRLKFASSNFEWHQFVVVRSPIRYMALLATSIRGHKDKVAMLRELDETITTALNYGRVVTWNFLDSYQSVKLRAIDPSAPPILDWNTIYHTVSPEYLPALSRMLRDALDKHVCFSIQIPVLNEQLRWYLLRVVPSATPGQLIGIDIDISALKDMEEEMQNQRRQAEFALSAKTTFLANMSHEVRTPLNGMCGLLEILEGTDLNHEMQSMLVVLGDAFRKLLEVLNDTLDLVKTEQNKMSTAAVSFGPAEIVTQLLRVHARKMSPEVDLRVKTRPPVPILCIGDPHIFKRIANNLISNACKFTNRGFVKVQLISDEKTALVLKVKDTGIGISPDVQKTLFHIFQVGDDTATRRYGGMGVGLALVSRMLDLVKGTMSFQSHIGVGTTFTVTFPFQPMAWRFLPDSFKQKNFAMVFLFDAPWLLKELRRLGEFYGVHLLTVLDFPKTENLLAVVCGVEHVRAVLALGIQGLTIVVLSKTKVEIKNCNTVIFPVSANNLFKSLVDEAPMVQAAIAWNDAQILAVEDTKPSQLVLEKIFERVGCKLTIVDSAEEALTLVETREFDVIFMDATSRG
jgi:signal transduction histidine kinase